MRNLDFYLGNPFRTKRISVNNLIRFATDLLTRFKTCNEKGELNERIDATESALSRLADTCVSDFGKLGFRKSRKRTKDQFREALIPTIETIYAGVVATFGARSSLLKKFFPKGRTIFGRCRDDVLENVLASLVESLAEYQDQLGAEIVEDATSLRDTWQQIHDDSAGATALKAQAEENRRNARFLLERELFLNLLKVAELHETHQKQLGRYMQQYLLEPGTRSSEGESADLESSPEGASGSISGSTAAGSTSTSSSGAGYESTGSDR